MGCSESKENATIHVKSAQEKRCQATDLILSSSSSWSSGMGTSASTSSDKGATPPLTKRQDGSPVSLFLPSVKSGSERRTLRSGGYEELEDIPISDLGESLDARKMKTVWGTPTVASRGSASHLPSISSPSGEGSPPPSAESRDSGVFELDDIITENSLPEIVHRVEREFTPVENLDLTIRGTACPRILSGSQRLRQQEEEILETLRLEGFISTSRQRAAGGLAFELAEATSEIESAGGSIKPKNFLPRRHRDHLDRQMDRFHLRDLTSADVERRQFLADERRRMEMEAKLGKMALRSHHSNFEDKVEEMKKKKEEKIDVALVKRETHLKELRDKLKAQNQKAKQLKLKKIINGAPVPVPYAPSFRKFTQSDDHALN